MSRLPRWGYREITAFLKSQGYELCRQGKGDHELWWHPEKKVYGIVDHAKTYPIGTLKALLKNLEIDEKLLRLDQHQSRDRGRDR